MSRRRRVPADYQPEARAWWVTALMFLLLLLLALIPGCGGQQDDTPTGQHGDRGSMLVDALWMLGAIALGLLA